jgi:hypothetical protein
MRKKLLVNALAGLLALGAGSASAVTVDHFQATFDVTGLVLTCPSENVVLSGEGTVTETSILRVPGRTTLQLLFNLNGIHATGMSSGTIYRVTGVTATTSSFPVASEAGADTYTFAQTWKLVPQSGNGRVLSFQEVDVVVFSRTANWSTSVSTNWAAATRRVLRLHSPDVLGVDGGAVKI